MNTQRNVNFLFHPRMKQIRFGIGSPIYYDFKQSCLCLDTTPTVEPTLVPLSSLQVDPAGCFFEWQAWVKGRLKSKRYEAVNDIDRILIKGLADVQLLGCTLSEDRFDQVEFDAFDGLPRSITLRRTSLGTEHETVRLFWEGEKLIRLVPVVAERVTVTRLVVEGETIVVDGEIPIRFLPRLPPPVDSLVRSLIGAMAASRNLE